MQMERVDTTTSPDYTQRLVRIQGQGWKQLKFNPYRMFLRKHVNGSVLDVGCGIGRSLMYLKGKGVGVDNNPKSIAVCRAMGISAFLPSEFALNYSTEMPIFDTILLSHLAEHTGKEQALELVNTYKAFCKRNSQLILITPQLAGYRSDPTHREYLDKDDLLKIATLSGFIHGQKYFSYPFPCCVGNYFLYNENIVVAFS